MIYNYYTSSNTKFEDIDLFYFHQLENKPLIVVLQKLYNYFQSLNLHFICIHHHKNKYLNLVPTQIERYKSKLIINNDNTFCKSVINVFNVIIINDDAYKKYNFPNEKQLFLVDRLVKNGEIQFFYVQKIYNIITCTNIIFIQRKIIRSR